MKVQGSLMVAGALEKEAPGEEISREEQQLSDQEQCSRDIPRNNQHTSASLSLGCSAFRRATHSPNPNASRIQGGCRRCSSGSKLYNPQRALSAGTLQVRGGGTWVEKGKQKTSTGG